MVLELEGAEGVGHALDGVGLAVGEVVGGIDAPGVARARVRRVQDAVEDGIAHVDVARRHVDTGTQDAGAVRELAHAHAAEEVEALLGRAAAVGAVAPRLGQGAPIGADLIGGEVVDIGLAGTNQVLGPFVEPLEIVGSEVEVLAPIEAHPAHVRLDALDILMLFLDRVGVVEAQVAAAAEFLGDPRN